jgi:hypothetical protein
VQRKNKKKAHFCVKIEVTKPKLYTKRSSFYEKFTARFTSFQQEIVI